jgi:tetratricopeptide (TPR) repeat protein
MTVVQRCPDSLLARARAGTLSSLERSQLQRHLGQCEACRVSLAVGQDFDGALAAQSDDTRIVTRVVEAVRAAATVRASVSRPARRARRGGRLFAYSVAAALLTISCVVGAARPSVRRTLAVFLGLQDREVRNDAPTVEVIPRTVPRRESLGEMPVVASSSLDTPQAPTQEPTPSPRYGGLARADSSQGREASSAKDLFARANAERRAGDEPGAKRLYQELQQSYPQSPEAEVSRVALGRLLLERSDPQAALDQFDRAMNRPGQSDQAGLAEEALFGRATALLRLGRTDDERKTWLQLLQRFPGSVYADRASARLNEMSLAEAKDGPDLKPAAK